MRIRKHLLVGILTGFSLTFPFTSFGEEALQRVDAYLRPDFNVSLNGHKIELENPPVIINGNMYLPLKLIAEATGLNVNWNSQTMTAELSSLKFNENNPNSNINQNDLRKDVDQQVTDEQITTIEQIQDILLKRKNISYDESSNTGIYIMTDEEYQTYKRIVNRDVQLKYCMSVLNQFGIEYKHAFNTTEKSISFSIKFIYKDKIVLIFKDLGSENDNQNLNLI